ncbi:ABC-three component system protein [Janthinobacterium sp. PSPC2-1]|uniref:ABC-three component system protein n=1 Tax=unclassified Janthinobacterium TaxID=2610881 RepID=UPI003CFBA4A0
MAYDASPSWSGFNYQGKVALFHALFIINGKLSIDPNFDFSGYKLILENTEDFEIQINGNSNTIHQVKAYQDAEFSSYKNALFGLVLELEKNTSSDGFIHTWKKINSKPHKSIQDLLRDEFSGVVSDYLMSPCPKNTIIGRAASVDKKIPKQSAIIRNAFPAKTESELLSIINNIRLDINSSISRLSCYRYPDGNYFCDLLEVNNKIKEELSKAFTARAIFNSGKQIDNAFRFFLGEIDEYIISRHLALGSPIILPIEFDKILEVLAKDFEDVSAQYLHFEFKSAFFDKFDEFMGEPDLYVQPVLDTGALCNLTEIRNLLSPMRPEFLWRLYERFSPQMIFHTVNNLGAAMSVVELDAILLVLLKIFHEIDCGKIDYDLSAARLTYRSPLRPKAVYLPTTIRPDLTPSMIARRIFENPGLIESLFEINNLIYEGALINDLGQRGRNHTVAPDTASEDHRQKRMYICENLRLIPTTLAKSELNAD